LSLQVKGLMTLMVPLFAHISAAYFVQILRCLVQDLLALMQYFFPRIFFFLVHLSEYFVQTRVCFLHLAPGRNFVQDFFVSVLQEIFGLTLRQTLASACVVNPNPTIAMRANKIFFITVSP
tara:strand:+ start:71 stop:433 length:363 start_codon:yes stop_codon:yes gene_type:complete